MSLVHAIEIHFSTFLFSVNELDSIPVELSDFEKKVIAFIKEWVSDKKIFEFQTSGSTGIPKKIKFTRNQIQASAGLTASYFDLQKGQNALLCLDPDFIAGKMMIVRAIEIGMNLHCIEPTSNPLTTLNNKIDFTAIVPYQLEHIISDSTTLQRFISIEKVLVGGGLLSNDLNHKVENFPNSIYETFGMTETLTHIAVRKLSHDTNYFQTLPGISIAINESGCLQINASHLSNEVIQTNDMAIIHSVTQFELLGRSDNVINSGGFKISPETVEQKIQTLLNSKAPNHSFMIGSLPDKLLGEKLVLLIEATELKKETQEELLKEMKSFLKKWEVPKEIYALPSFIRTSSGKIRRKETLQNLL